jgi:hypothetical protein
MHNRIHLTDEMTPAIRCYSIPLNLARLYRPAARQDKYLVPIVEQGFSKSHPKKAGAAGDQHFHNNSCAIECRLLRIQ